VVGKSGNISERGPRGNRIGISPMLIDYEKTDVDDVVAIDFDGEIPDGNPDPSLEWQMNRAVYEASDAVEAIVHTHPSSRPSSPPSRPTSRRSSGDHDGDRRHGLGHELRPLRE
jgi:hypothetical protein